MGDPLCLQHGVLAFRVLGRLQLLERLPKVIQLPAIGRATGTLQSIKKALDTLSDVAARRGDCGRTYGHRIVLSRSTVGRLGRHTGLVIESRRLSLGRPNAEQSALVSAIVR